MKLLSNLLYWSLIVFALIQFIPIDRTQKPIDKTQNFTELMQTPGEIKTLLKNSCYDCHSNETFYPDYAYVAPISWAVSNHVSRGREFLNFSEWGKYNNNQKKSVLENTISDLKTRSMPLPGYIIYHPEAQLSDTENTLLIEYFEELLKTYSSK